MELSFCGQYFKKENKMKKITEKELIKLMKEDDVQLSYNNHIEVVQGEQHVVQIVEVIRYGYRDEEIEDNLDYYFGEDLVCSLDSYGFNVSELYSKAEEIGKLAKELIEEKYGKLVPNKVKYIVSTEKYIYEN